MDGSLWLLLILSVGLLAMLIPHTTFTVIAILVLSTLATRGSWAVVQVFVSSDTRRPFD
jgi:hypothetical protein